MSKNTGTSELINYFDLGANGDVGIAGSLDVNTIANATTDTDKFLVSDTGIIKYRTGAELLSDIGAQGLLTNPVTGTGSTGQVTYWSSGSAITGSSNFLFNASERNLTIDRSLSTLGNAITISKLGDADQAWLAFRQGGGASGTWRLGYTGSVYDFRINVGSDGSIGTQALRIFQSTQNVVIGTATSDPNFKLDVNGTGRFSGNLSVIRSSGGSVLTLQSTATNGEAQVDLEGRNSSGTVRNATFKYDNADIIRLGTSSNIGMRFETNDAPRLTITSGGNVGIGASSLLEKLGVNGNIHVEGVGNSIYFDTDGNGRTIQQYVANQFQFHIVNARGNSARFILGNSSISLGTSSTPQFNINTTNGNIGIGTVSDNGRKLNVNGSGLFSGTLSTAKVEVGAVESVNITTNSTFTLVSSSYFNIRTNILISVTIRWNNNANAQRQYLLFIGATDTGWGTPNSAISVIASNDWSSGYVGAATFSIGGSGALRTLNISVSNAATYNVTAYAAIVDM
jgi:hypothetical protein